MWLVIEQRHLCVALSFHGPQESEWFGLPPLACSSQVRLGRPPLPWNGVAQLPDAIVSDQPLQPRTVVSPGIPQFLIR